MTQPNHNIDTTFTKLYVGGLLWSTREEGLRNYFQQFGEIIHVNVVIDRARDRSQGYGFVTFKDAKSATRACLNPNPIIDGRETNCKLASSGANVNHNQSNLVPIYENDLCFSSQSSGQNVQQYPNSYQPASSGQNVLQYPNFYQPASSGQNVQQYPNSYQPASFGQNVQQYPNSYHPASSGQNVQQYPNSYQPASSGQNVQQYPNSYQPASSGQNVQQYPNSYQPASFGQNVQQYPNSYQPAYTGPYWNQYYQQYSPQNYWYPQQYNPGFYQHYYPMVNNNNPMYWPNQSDGNKQR